ncbi:MAG: translocation/assembly module TamB domain-containing protein [Candidatus Eremiobacteraeota bacterium]|nr:translocation/assembly module TamB domain-containing protein [Candidatus Eremiobacteraeota bacterium]
MTVRVRALLFILLLIVAGSAIMILAFRDVLISSSLKAECRKASLDITWGRATLAWGCVRLTDVEFRAKDGTPICRAGELILRFNPLKLIFLREKAGALTSVTLSDPLCFVSRDKKGAWNFHKLGKVSPGAFEKALSAFHGSIALSGGKVLFSDEGKGALFERTFTEIALSVQPERASYFTLKVDAREGQGRLGGKGKLSLAAPSLSFDGEARSIEAAPWISYLAGKEGPVITRGSADATCMMRGRARTLDGLPKALYIEGALSAEGLEGKVAPRGFSFQGVKGRARFSDDFIAVDEMSGRLEGAPFSLKGEVMNLHNPVLDLTVSVKGFEGKLLGKAAKGSSIDSISGRIACDAHIEGAPSDPRVEGRIEMKEGSLGTMKVKNLLVEALYTRPGIRIKKFESLVNGSPISGQGWIFPGSRTLLVDLKGIRSPFRYEVNKGGPLWGEADYHVSLLGSFIRPMIMGSATLRNLSWGPRSLGESTADFIMSGDSLFLSQGYLRTGTGLVKASGLVDMGKKELDLTVGVSDYPLAALGPLLPALQGGRLSGLMKIRGPMGRPAVYGTVAGGQLQAGGLRLSNFYVPFESDGAFVRLMAGSASLEGVPLSFSGGVMLAPSPFIQLKFLAPRIKFASLAALKVPLKGEGSLTASLVGSTEVGYLIKGDALIEKGRASASGWVAPREAGGLISLLSFKNIDLPAVMLPSGKGKAFEGFVEKGHVLVVGDRRRLSLGSHFSFLGAQVLGFPLSSLYSDAFFSGPLLSLGSTYARGAAGSLSAEGTVNLGKRSWKLQMEGTGLDIAYLARNLNLAPWGIAMAAHAASPQWSSLQGIAGVKGELTGSGNSPSFTGEVKVSEGVWNNEVLDFASRFTMVPSLTAIHSMALHVGKSSLEGKGTVTHGREPVLDLALVSSHGDLAKMIAFSPWKNMAVKGEMNGDLKVKGPLKNLLVTGKVTISRAAFNGQPVEEVTADVRTEGKSLNVENLRALFSEGEITGKGTISQDGRLAMTFSASRFPLSQITALSRLSEAPRGTVDMTMEVGGTRNEPSVKASFSMNDLVLGRESFEKAQGTLSWNHGVLGLADISLSQGDERYDLKGTLTFPSGVVPMKREAWYGASLHTPRFDVETQFQNARLDFLLPLASGKAFPDLKGKLDGSCAFRGTLADPSFSFDVALREGIFKGVPIEKFTAKAGYEARHFTGLDLELKTPHSEVSFHRDAGAEQGTDIRVNAKNLDLAFLSGFLPLPEKFRMSGLLDMTGSVSGDLLLPDVASEIKLTDGSVGGFDFDTMKGRIEARRGVFSFKDFSIVEGGRKVSLTGTMPLMLKDRRIESTAPMELKADINENDLDFISLFMPLEGKTSGSLFGSLEVKGMLPDITVDGSLVIKDGEFQPRALKKPVTAVKAIIQFANQKLVVKNLEGKMGQGTFTIAGEIEGSQGSLSRVGLKFAGKDLQILAKEYFSGIADIEGSLEGDAHGKTLSAKVTARNSTLHIPTEVLMKEPEDMERDMARMKAMIPRAIRSIGVNVDIELARDNWLTFMTSSFLCQGTLALRGTIPDIGVSGEVDLYRGTLNLPLLETPFKVYQGKAVFDGKSLSPELAVEAEADIGNYRIYMDLTGKIDKPRVELTSEPPMVQEGIERMIATELQSNYLTGGALQANAMATRLAERILDLNLVQPFFHAIGRTFALSDVSLEYNYNGRWAMRLAKALDSRERLLATYERIEGSTGWLYTLFGLEYRFRRGMLLRVSQDQLGQSYIWVQLRHPFGSP